MKALYYTEAGRKNGSVTDIPYPTCEEKQVIVKVESCGICIGVEEGHDTTGTALSVYPVVPGHEFAGFVHEIGAGVKAVSVGDRVTVDNTLPCGECYYCKKNKPLHCRNFGSLGHNVNGGMAEYVLVSEDKVYKIPDHLSFNEAAMAEPVGCCIHAMDQLNIKYGDEIVVLGAGPQGMILAQLAKHSNASKVIVIGSTQEKLDVLENLGIDTILMDRNDYSKHEKELFSKMPHGADCLIDATGAQELVYESAKLMKMGGKILGYGYYHGGADLAFPFSTFWDKECTYLSTLSQTGDFDRAVDAIATGKVNTKILLTEEYDLDHYFDALDRNMTDRSVIKLIIHPNI
ncbi:chlorophyll synthesis pathway protein BchC [Enterococcus sp. AZ135]|uniref:alcohol dehydrogenase catalytic domain-containing protein n=1 Tax=unclassified Enterococcus TaxID=2608891 RepID=UPI003F279621